MARNRNSKGKAGAAVVLALFATLALNVSGYRVRQVGPVARTIAAATGE